MYQLANNVLGTLKYDIAGGALAIVVAPIAATPFNLPPAPTDALVPTYGKPYGLLIIADRLDLSQAKYEIALYSARAAEAAGAYTYTIAAGGRGWEATAAQAWVAGAYILGIATENFLAGEGRSAVMRAEFLLTHKRDAVITWDGANLKFDTFICHGAGRGKHWGSDGYFTIAMPANATVVKGFGGAADANVAAGAIPIAAKHALYFEPYISGPNATIGGNFRLVATTADYAVPLHWILLAVHSEVVAGDKLLRLATGEMMTPWFAIGGGAPAPAFVNAWVDYAGAYSQTAMRKYNGHVELRGLVKTGNIGQTIFQLPAGWRPASSLLMATISNGAFGSLQIDNTGVVNAAIGNNTYVSLFNIRFTPEA
jgi:hypothetical protein